MFKYFIYFLFIISFSAFSIRSDQAPWTKETAQGFPIDQGQLEITEGFGAYMDFCLRPNTRNFDNGGGSFNYNTEFLKTYKGVTNIVYDPFQRSESENELALLEVAKHNFDTATSNSVLNVIDNKSDRLKHISLCCEALREGGVAYFKVYPGDSSGQERYPKHGYQSNRPAMTYQSEVEEVFGKGNVVVHIERHMIMAYKNRGCQSLELEQSMEH